MAAGCSLAICSLPSEGRTSTLITLTINAEFRMPATCHLHPWLIESRKPHNFLPQRERLLSVLKCSCLVHALLLTYVTQPLHLGETLKLAGRKGLDQVSDFRERKSRSFGSGSSPLSTVALAVLYATGYPKHDGGYLKAKARSETTSHSSTVSATLSRYICYTSRQD
jgi:hypothetical protein